MFCLRIGKLNLAILSVLKGIAVTLIQIQSEAAVASLVNTYLIRTALILIRVGDIGRQRDYGSFTDEDRDPVKGGIRVYIASAAITFSRV